MVDAQKVKVGSWPINYAPNHLVKEQSVKYGLRGKIAVKMVCVRDWYGMVY